MKINNFSQSKRWLERAEISIPLGSQTFSKSKVVYPLDVSPLFIEKGKGCQVWDVDGNQYTDFVNGLLSVSIGYCDEEIDRAVLKQLANGVTFSLAHPLESIVAEKVIKHIPCAEQVRFGKNGSDATSAAIRLARAYTGKERVAVCGYHGWQDWYIGSTTRDLGVPQAVKSLTDKFTYNDIQSLEQLLLNNQGQYAAVILEPMNVDFPQDDFLSKVRRLCDDHDIVLIFDETITGFRFNIGGAQALFNVTPDLATFGKGVANGFPLSIITGKESIMRLMEDIFYSGTFGGETLSLAAANAVIDKLASSPVLEHIERMGKRIIDGLNDIIIQHNAQELFYVSGHPAWSFLRVKQTNNISEQQLSSLMQQEMHAQGILTGMAHNISFAHKETDIDKLLAAYNEILPLIVQVNNHGGFEKHFHGQVTQPVFKVR